jgi:hypothetical protein
MGTQTMTEWTPEALEYLEGYLQQVRALARQAGEDPEEVVGGLREHIVHKVEETAPSLASIDQLRRALAGVGSPEEILSVKPEVREFKRTVSPAPLERPRAMSATPPDYQARAATRRFPIVSCAVAAILVPVLFIGSVFLWLLSMRLDAEKKTMRLAAEKQMAAILQVISAQENEYLKNGKHDADGDGKPDYATLDQMKAAGHQLGLDAGNTKGAYLVSLKVINSSEEGGPWFTCTASPLLKGELTQMLVDPTGEIHENTFESIELNASKGDLDESAAVAALETIAAAQRRLFEQGGKDYDGDKRPDYAPNIEELHLNGAFTVYSETNIDLKNPSRAGGFMIHIDAIGSAEPGGPSFVCSAIPPVESGFSRRIVKIDHTGKLYFDLRPATEMPRDK